LSRYHTVSYAIARSLVLNTLSLTSANCLNSAVPLLYAAHGIRVGDDDWPGIRALK